MWCILRLKARRIHRQNLPPESLLCIRLRAPQKAQLKVQLQTPPQHRLDRPPKVRRPRQLRILQWRPRAIPPNNLQDLPQECPRLQHPPRPGCAHGLKRRKCAIRRITAIGKQAKARSPRNVNGVQNPRNDPQVLARSPNALRCIKPNAKGLDIVNINAENATQCLKHTEHTENQRNIKLHLSDKVNIAPFPT